MHVQFDLKGATNISSAKKTPTGRGRGGSSAAAEKKAAEVQGLVERETDEGR